jgi:hypothetical protein
MQYPYGHAHHHRHHEPVNFYRRGRMTWMLRRSDGAGSLPAMPAMTPVGKPPITPSYVV